MQNQENSLSSKIRKNMLRLKPEINLKGGGGGRPTQLGGHRKDGRGSRHLFFRMGGGGGQRGEERGTGRTRRGISQVKEAPKSPTTTLQNCIRKKSDTGKRKVRGWDKPE